MAPKIQKSKEAKAKAAAAGGKSKKKRWSKGKVRDKLNNAVLFDKATKDKLLNEIPKAKLITPATISERLKVTASAAKQGIRFLAAEGLIRPVGDQHHTLPIYTRASHKEADVKDEAPEKATATKKVSKKQQKKDAAAAGEE
eukprot:Filipodium_phascolosomae@DN668_c0_g1_i1.p1